MLLWVKETSRGQRIGGSLLGKAKKHGNSLGARWLQLGTEKFGGGVAFYKKCSPDVSEEYYSHEYKTDIVAFAWKLDPPFQQPQDPFGLHNPPLIDFLPPLEDGIKSILVATKIPSAAYWTGDSETCEEKGEVSAKTELDSLRGENPKVFPIGSLTKPVFAYAFGKLLQDIPGRINLSDLVSKHLDLDLSPYETTIHQMFCHRNGLPGGNETIIGPGNVLLAPNDEKDFLSMVQKVFNLAKRGGFPTNADGSWKDRDEYSNLNIACIAVIVKKVFKLSVPDLIRNYVIMPLGLKHMHVSAPTTLVHCYEVGRDGRQNPVKLLDHSKNEYTLAMIGILSTTDDFGKFLQHLLQEVRVREQKGESLNKLIFGRCDKSPDVNRYFPIGLISYLDGIDGSAFSLNEKKCPSASYLLGRLPAEQSPKGRPLIWRFQGHVHGCSSSFAIVPRADFISVVLRPLQGL